MGFAVFLKEYVLWHYSGAFQDMIELEKNFLWFGYNFFSIPLFLKTLFSPMFRLTAKVSRGIDVETFFEILVGNIFARIAGFFFRAVVIVFGIAFEVLLLLFFIPFVILWVLLPAVVLALVIAGVFSII